MAAREPVGAGTLVDETFIPSAALARLGREHQAQAQKFGAIVFERPPVGIGEHGDGHDPGVVAHDAVDGLGEDALAGSIPAGKEHQHFLARQAGEAIAAVARQEADDVFVAVERVAQEVDPALAVGTFARCNRR